MLRALRRLVPDTVLDRRVKMSFVTTQEAWLPGSLAPWLRPLKMVFLIWIFHLRQLLIMGSRL